MAAAARSINLLALPNEIILCIVSTLDPPNLNSFLRTNRQLHTLLTPLLTRIFTKIKDDLLIQATCRSDAPFVRRLLDAGANPDHRNKRGQSALHKAAKHGSAEIIKMLIDAGADIDAVEKNVHSRRQRTPLCLAAKYGRVDAVRMLVDGGADVNFYNRKGISVIGEVLHTGPERFSESVFEMLLDNGLDIDTQFETLRLARLSLDSMNFSASESLPPDDLFEIRLIKMLELRGVHLQPGYNTST